MAMTREQGRLIVNAKADLQGWDLLAARKHNDKAHQLSLRRVEGDKAVAIVAYMDSDLLREYLDDRLHDVKQLIMATSKKGFTK